MLASEHLRQRGFFAPERDAPGGVAMRAFPPWRLHPEGKVRWGAAPRVGEHTEAVLAALGAPAGVRRTIRSE